MFINNTIDQQYYQLNTPFLLLDKATFIQNIVNMRSNIESNGVVLNPHFKTLKSLAGLAYLAPDKHAPITVSTLAEAEALIDNGYVNITYAVGISAGKLQRIAKILSKNIQFSVILDSLEQVQYIDDFCQYSPHAISVLIEIDCDGHRGGVTPNSPILLDMAKQLRATGADFKGILIHAGESYHCENNEQLIFSAANEVAVASHVSGILKHNGYPCKTISIGSTPTASRYQNLTGITEVRAGVFCFYDLVMKDLGICNTDDIAISVVTSVIGHNLDKGWLLVDAGWTALSLDAGSTAGTSTPRYGAVLDTQGNAIAHLHVTALNQEHGIITSIDNTPVDFAQFPIGSRIQILPNHACATSVMHDQFNVFDVNDHSYEIWPRIKGW